MLTNFVFIRRWYQPSQYIKYVPSVWTFTFIRRVTSHSSCPARSTMYSSFPRLPCGSVHDCWMDSCDLTTLVGLWVIEQCSNVSLYSSARSFSLGYPSILQTENPRGGETHEHVFVFVELKIWFFTMCFDDFCSNRYLPNWYSLTSWLYHSYSPWRNLYSRHLVMTVLPVSSQSMLRNWLVLLLLG
jgi:hypothetical protein